MKRKYKAREIAADIKSRKLTCADVAGEALQTIKAINPKLNAIITSCDDLAYSTAERLQADLDKGKTLGPLAGVPVIVKDNITVKGYPATCASRILENHVAVYDATVVRKIKDAGMIIVGKANMDEFAMGSSNENSYFDPVKNPIDNTRVPGGSSGGSAAAVAAGFAPLALGSDTGGSVRLPASFCGAVGMKPSYGRVSRYGLIAFASSLDQIGPISHDVTDCAMFLSIICGEDANDSTCTPEPAPDFAATLNQGFAGLTVGLPKEYFGEGINPQVREAVQKIVSALEKEGVKLIEVELPTTAYAIATYYVIADAEASSNLARYDAIKYGYRSSEGIDLLDTYRKTRSAGFGSEVRRRIVLGTYVLSSGYYEAYYRRAQKVRTLIKNDFEEAFARCDVLLTPTSPTTAFRLGERIDDPLSMYLSDIFTVGAPLAGLPAISIPCGQDSSGLPIGAQLVGRYMDETTLLRAAYGIERLLA